MKHIAIRRRQEGVVLIVSLVILLVATLIGVSAMKANRLEERIAYNSNDTNLSFQAAEMALRAGETWLGDLDDEPARSDAGCTVDCGVWADPDAFFAAAGSASGYSDPALWAWDKDDNGSPDTSPLTGPGVRQLAVPITTSKESPRYAVVFGFPIKDSQNLGQQQDVSPGSYRNFYSVIGAGTGGSQFAKSYLESVYARRY
jgi:type IV pilus assembly protein PilX